MSFLRRVAIVVASAAVACGLGILTGCGTPGAPQPPSLHLPGRVEDLGGQRAGDSVALHWTMPRKTTDHLAIKGPVDAVVCWREAADHAATSAGECHKAGEVTLTAEVAGEFRGPLPEALRTGSPRQIGYFVDLRNTKGRSAGLSNELALLAGAAPGAVEELTAEVRTDGVALRWRQGEATAVRLHRRLLTPERKASPGGLMSAPTELPVQDLLVSAADVAAKAGALDETARDGGARFGQSYEYTAQRVIQIQAGGKTLELAGAICAPVKVDVIDVFPPAVPAGLAAVYVPEDKSMDLSWQPDTEPDMAGYIVYRAAAGETEWKRVSPAQPVATPAYRDATVQAGQSYRYAVSAIDLTGHESKRSAETSESVPIP
jgi:hypothetical protein